MSATEPSPSLPAGLSEETKLAVRNASKLGLSLVGTWLVAMVVRLYLPRHLGPETFGLYNFAESLSMTCFAFLTLGVNDYSLREVAARPGHASDYFGGLVVVRTILGALMVAVVPAILLRTGPEGSPSLFAVFGVGYFVFSIANTLASFLQANATVDRLALSNVVAKVLWGGLMVAALVAGAPLSVLAAILAASEAAKTIILYRESQKQLGLRFRVDWTQTRQVLVAAVPYFATSIVLYLNRLEVAVLGFIAANEEVGWYGAAGNLSMLVCLLIPLMPAVLLPTLRRVQARSEADLWRVIHRTTEGIVVTCVPIALVVGLGADVWVRTAFGAEFANAAPSLRVLSLQVVLTYMACLTSLALIVIDRRWTVTMSSVFGLVANPVVGVTGILVLGRVLGPGGAGAGAAMGAIGAEAVVLGIQMSVLGSRMFGPRTRALLVRCALLCAGVVGLHVLLAPLGPLRLVVDVAVYAVVGIPLGVLPVREVTGLVRELTASRRGEQGAERP